MSFILFFTTPVITNEELAELIDAVNNGTIGPFKVTNLKIIQQVEPTPAPSASPTTEGGNPPSTGILLCNMTSCVNEHTL